MKKPKHYIRPLLRKFGRDLIVYDHLHHPLARRAKLISFNNIDVVIDIGANRGQYARELRGAGYDGKIISFEPLSNAFVELEQWSRNDGNSIAINKAVGDRDGEIEFNIAANSTSSSVLDMLPAHTNAAPHSSIIGTEKVKITRLDSIYEEFCPTGQKVLLKIDTQGYEMSVLEGSANSLVKVTALQLEMSFVRLYKGQVLFIEMLAYLEARGFKLVDINPMFIHPQSGEVLQVDGFFVRS